MKKMLNRVKDFIDESDGAQVVEYALIIALVSIVLTLALANANVNLVDGFADLVARLQICFAPGATTC